MFVESNYHSSQFYSSIARSLSKAWEPCKKVIFEIFGQLAQLTWQAIKSLTAWVWKRLNRPSLTLQLIRSSDSELLPIGTGQSLPIDLVSAHICPYLPAEKLRLLLLTNKSYLKLLEKPLVLDTLFSDPKVNHQKLASLIPSSMSQVTKLNLKESRMTEWQLIKLIEKCPNLTDLNLYSLNGNEKTRVTSRTIFTVAKSCPRLFRLNVSHCQYISSQALQKIFQSCQDLRWIDLQSCLGVEEEVFQTIARQCRNLSHINLANCAAPDTAIQALARQCPHLTSIDLDRWDWLEDKTIQELAEKCPNLENVSLSRCSITGIALQALAQHCHRLTHLNLNDDKNITNQSILALAKNRLTLSHLKLGWCQEITDVAIEAIAKSCPNLESIVISGCTKLTNAAIEALAIDCPSLTEIYLSGRLDNIGDRAIEALAQGCPNLKIADLTACQQISDSAINGLLKNCPDLRTLWLGHTNISDRAIQTWTAIYPNLRIIY